MAEVKPDRIEDEGSPAPAIASDAGTDESIAERLARDPGSKDARLDRALDESMDASDPPASTQPVHSHHAPKSSGYDPHAEARLAKERKPGLIARIIAAIGGR